MAGELEYAGRNIAMGKLRRHLLPWTLAAMAMTLLAVTTCVRIEILNAQLSYYLPRNKPNDRGPWRGSLETSEARWRKFNSYRDPTLLTRPLTKAEETTMKSAVARAKKWNALLEAVGSWGLCQYPLVAVLIGTFTILFWLHDEWKWRAIILANLALILGCTSLMFYRGYFSSLGF